MLPSFATETVQRVRAAQAASRGAAYRDWDAATTLAVAGCSVQPDSTSSDYSDRQQTQATYTLYAPAGSDIAKGDRIIAEAGTFDVVGVAFTWRSPSGTTDHMVLRMTEWAG